jgi:hypothetical protein
VYWVGPGVGAVVAVLVHVLFDEFGGPAPLRVLKECKE